MGMRLGFLAVVVVAVMYGWHVMASLLYCVLSGHEALFIFPFLQWAQVAPYWLSNTATAVWFVVSALPPTAFLCVIAVVPMAVAEQMLIDPRITAFLGGTGLLIVVSVALDMVQRIEANLLMRNYSGFLGGDSGKGKRIKGRQY